MPPQTQQQDEQRKRILSEIDKQILAYYLTLDSKGRFVNQPSNNDELHEFIKAAFGFAIPTKVVEPGHSSPFEFVADCYFERVKNALAFASRNGGKALAIDTPIFTPDGWKTLGCISVGERVFASDGSPSRVITESPVREDHSCFVLCFDSGDEIVADAEHVWCVRNNETKKYSDLTTDRIREEMQAYDCGRYGNLFTVDTAGALELPEADLPVPPYVVGAWLGDGGRWDNRFFSDDQEIVEYIRTLWPVDYVGFTNDVGTCKTYNLPRVRAKLRRWGDWPKRGRQKHIPDGYLYASRAQRLELLRGLMDTDGSVARSRPNRCEISLVDQRLAHGVLWLVRSLGGAPKIYDRGPGVCSGRRVGKDVYRVSWRATDDLVPFRLSRKLAVMTTARYRVAHKIVGVRQIESEPVKCIGIDHSSHLYLAGDSLIPTHNTLNVAILNMVDMLFKPKCEIASAGAVRDQAKKCYKYFQTFLAEDWFNDLCADYQAKTGKRFLTKEIQEETKFANGSEQQILTATDTGLRSPHPHKARIDEVDEIEWKTLQTGLSMARTDSGIRGQNIFTSTRQHPDGAMQRLLKESTAKGIRIYEWNIWEAVQRCERRCFDDPEHGSCPIYTYCKGKAHHCAGFYAIEDFIDKVRLIDRETFETEWENKRPSRGKLVYGSFDETRHVMTPSKLFHMTGRTSVTGVWYRIASIDFGSSPGHPFVYVKIAQLPRGAWLIFYEYVADQKLMRDHATSIKASPLWLPSEKTYADTSGKQERIELKRYGIRTRDSIKDVKMGINHVRELLNGFPPAEEPVLFVWHECIFTIAEFGLYSWPIRPDGKPDKSGVPKKENDHAMDATRYGLYTHACGGSRRKYRARRIRGV